MSVEMLYDPQKEAAVMFCNTSGQAFGPMLTDVSEDEAEDFLRWVEQDQGIDPRRLEVGELFKLVARWGGK